MNEGWKDVCVHYMQMNGRMDEWMDGRMLCVYIICR